MAFKPFQTVKHWSIGRLQFERLAWRYQSVFVKTEYERTNLAIEDYDAIGHKAAPLVSGKIYRLWIKPLRLLITYDGTKVNRRADIEELYAQRDDALELHFIPTKADKNETVAIFMAGNRTP